MQQLDHDNLRIVQRHALHELHVDRVVHVVAHEALQIRKAEDVAVECYTALRLGNTALQLPNKNALGVLRQDLLDQLLRVLHALINLNTHFRIVGALHLGPLRTLGLRISILS